MGILMGLAATVAIIGSIIIIIFLVAWYQHYKASFQQKYSRSFYHVWAILSWMAMPLSILALYAGISWDIPESQLWYGWVPIFSLLGAYLFYIKRYGSSVGLTVITLQLIPGCLAIGLVLFIFYIANQLSEGDG